MLQPMSPYKCYVTSSALSRVKDHKNTVLNSKTTQWPYSSEKLSYSTPIFDNF